MSIYYVISANANDRSSERSSTVSWADCATGAGSGTGHYLGATFSSPTWQNHQAFLEFNTSAVTGTITSATLSLNFDINANTEAEPVDVRNLSWTPPVAAGTYRTRTQVEAATLVATGTIPASTTGRISFSYTSPSSDVSISSTYRVMLHSQRQRTGGTAPAGAAARSFSEATGSATDAVLSLLTGTPWSIVGVGTVVEAATTAITLTEPAGVADGDLLVACFASRTTATTAVSNTGWMEVNSQNNNNISATAGSAVASGTMLYQVRAGTPDLTFVVPAGISVIRGQIVAYRGNDTTSPFPFAAISPTSNAYGTSGANATYSVVRTSTAATTTPGTATVDVGHRFLSSNYTSYQYFMTFNTSSIPAGVTSANLSINITIAGIGDSLEVHEVPSSANMISNAVIDTYPLLGAHLQTSTAARYNILLDISGMTRGSSVVLCLSSKDDRLNVPPTSVEDQTISTLAAAANLQPFLGPAATTAGTTGAVTAVSVSGLTTTQDDDLIVALAAGGQEATWSGFSNATTPLTASGATSTTTAPSPSAWTERAESITTTGADTSLAIFDAVRTTAGATGNLTVTASIASGHVVVAGAFRIATAAGGGISVPVTGVSATGAVGSVTVATVASVSVPVTGVQATGQIASVTAIGRTPVSVPVTGVEATGVVDSVSAAGRANVSTTGVAAAGSVNAVTIAGKANVSTIGVEATGAVGTASAVVTATPVVTGVEATGAIGTATVAGKANVSTTGVEATGSVGTVTVSTTTRVDVSTPVTGVSATGSVNGVTVVGKASVTAIGVQGAGSVGTVTAIGGVSVSTAVTGVFAAGSVGTATVAGKANAAAIGVEATGIVGTVIATGRTGITVAATGVQATGSVDQVTITGKASVPLTGVQATSGLGNVSVTAGGSISTGVTGVQATGSVGTVVVLLRGDAAATGVSAAGSVGSVSIVGKVNAPLTGVLATAAVGSVSVLAGATEPIADAWDWTRTTGPVVLSNGDRTATAEAA